MSERPNLFAPEWAHQVRNTGSGTARFLMVSEMNAPEVSVYPDSGKVAAFTRAPGAAPDPNAEDELALFFRRADDVDYYDGERGPEPRA